MKNKMGGMPLLKVILGVLFAIIIFAPSIFLASQLFGASQQAKENFNDFVNEVKDFAKDSQDGDIRNFMLIMDENSAIYGFNKDSLGIQFHGGTVGITRTRILGTNDYHRHYIIYPEDKCNNQNCICLCPEEEYTDVNDGERGASPERMVTCDSLSCTPFESINIIGQEDKNFRFSRLDEGDTISEERRNLLYFVKEEGKIIITTEIKNE
jgi:hypothetical protein